MARFLIPANAQTVARYLAPWLGVCLAAMSALGCAAASRSPASQLVDGANEFNVATRFGRMDMALQQTAPSFREHFLDSHQAWGNEIRIVDINVTGVRLSDEENADVLVQVAWTRMSESTLRSTTINQTWKNPNYDGWQLHREHRVQGDAGLFGEPLPASAAVPPRDVHFPTKSLGTVQ